MFDFIFYTKSKFPVICISVFLSFLIPSSGLSQIYNFDDGTLQGWTMQGIHAYNTYPTVYTNPFTLSWDDATQHPGASGSDPIGNGLGSASIYTSSLTLPSNFPSGASFWLIDIVSPDVTSDQQWQDLTGISVNIHSTGFSQGEGSIQILLNATKKSDGQETWLLEWVSGQSKFYTLTSGWINIQADHFVNLSDYTINHVRIRIFGNPTVTGSMREINIDNVTAISESAGSGLSGYVKTYMCGEAGNGIDISYDSYFTQIHQLTHARIDFTGTNVYIDQLGSMVIINSPEVTDIKKITNQILEIDFSGFAPGEVVSVGLDLDIGPTGSYSPYGSTYVGATIEITFTGLPCDMPLTGTFEEIGTWSAQANFSCGGTSDAIPPPPSDLTVTLFSSTQIDLTWVDNSDNETGFKIERKTGVLGTYQIINTTLANQKSYSDTDVNPNTSYYYRVFAFNNAGTSTYSNEGSVSTEDYGTYILEFELFPAYPYNTSDYKLGGVLTGCGPTTGAMILGYFEHVYSLPAPNGLLTNPGQGLDEGLNTAWVLHGYEYMNTNDDGFGSQYNIKSGLEGYANGRGYEVEVMIHVSPAYSSDSDAWDNYGDYGDAWMNDGYFWQQNPGGDWQINVTDFCNFADSVFALNIPLFLTIDTDMDQSGDHWVPMVGYDRNSEKYAFYNTYSQTLQWADIHYTLAAEPIHDNSIMMVRTVGFVIEDNLPAAPTDLVACCIPEQVHLTWEDNSDNEDGFIIQKKYTPCLEYLNFYQTIDTVDANTTSYQTAAPTSFTQTFYFRVLAYNEFGNSDYSNIATVKSYLTLSSLRIISPNGGEEFAPYSTQNITWNSFGSSPAYIINKVTIKYSTDGGSNWVDPPIASNIDNSGSFSWTVPDTESDNCIIKIEDAYDGSPYDLSNFPFTIGIPITPVISLDTDTLDFDTHINELNFQIENTGGGTLTWTVSETPDMLWITSLDPISGTGDATVTVNVDRSHLSGSSGIGLLKITSNGGNQEIIVLIKKPIGTLPDDWVFYETGNNATIVLPTVANPNIKGSPLEKRDYIGAFTSEDLCCGFSEWQAENLSLTVWGDDTQTSEVDGFQSGEVINYRVYRIDENKEWCTVTVAYSQGTGSYAVDAFMVLSQFDATDAVEFTVNFLQGWNMFSINIDPVYPEIDSVMSSISDKVVIMKDGTGNAYVPDYGINNIGNIDYTQGYKVYMNESAELKLIGQPVDPSTPINLESGWSIISYLPGSSMDAAVALASISDELVIAKNGAGETYVPSYDINTIGDMEPGQGYKVYLDASATLVYPGKSFPKTTPNLARNDASSYDVENNVQHFQFSSNTGQNCTVVIPSSIEPRYWSGSLLASGDEIGVFTSEDLCCGAVVWNNENKAITVWGDNVQTADTVDGFLENDTLHFRVWDCIGDAEYRAQAVFTNATNCVYHSDGYGVLTELIAQEGSNISGVSESVIPDKFSLHQNYPNPFNPKTAIEFQLPMESEVRLTVYDIKGREICCLANKVLSAGVHTVHWQGTDQTGDSMASGIYFYQLAVNPLNGSFERTVLVRKMLFMK